MKYPFPAWLALGILLCGSVEARRAHRHLDEEIGSVPTSAQALPPGATAEVGFAPHRGAIGLVLKAIGESRTGIDVAAYEFTSKAIAQALLEARARGVQVRIVVDAKESRARASKAGFLASQGLSVRCNGHYSIHHNKFMVIDGHTVETGSFNYTEAAIERNAENVLVLRNVPDLSATYGKEWQRLWDEAEPMGSR
jgi:phosphatidylserine/phosphatidylglycerophosphate/cardiolipin synthase-like enzyme